MAKRARSGSKLPFVVVAFGAIYFTGAGGWMVGQSKTLSTQCFSSLQSIAGDATANGVCGAAIKTIDAIERSSAFVDAKVEAVRQRLSGSEDGVEAAVKAVSKKIASYSSPKEALDKMFKDGIYSIKQPASTNEGAQFQMAVDTFAIGKKYLSTDTTASIAVPWLQASANQPGGFGLLSQLTLADAYGNGKGLPKDNLLAQGYLKQADQSLATLMGSRSPEAQIMLKSLPTSPQVMQAQIARVMRQLQIEMR